MKKIKIKKFRKYIIGIIATVLTALVFWGCCYAAESNKEPETTTESTDETTDEPKEEQPEYSVKYYDVPLDIALQNHIFNLSAEYSINPKYIIAIIAEESAFGSLIIGDNGDSIGLMQIQSKWHGERMKRLSCNDLYDPFQNITVGVDYLSELMNYYDGDIVKAIVAYQQGSFKGEITEYAADVLLIAASLEVKADV